MELVKIKANDEFHWGVEQQWAFEEIRIFVKTTCVGSTPAG
jgi:hypothetical protein